MERNPKKSHLTVNNLHVKLLLSKDVGGYFCCMTTKARSTVECAVVEVVIVKCTLKVYVVTVYFNAVCMHITHLVYSVVLQRRPTVLIA